MNDIYICRPGSPHSAMRLDTEPSQDDWKIFHRMGFARAELGERYRKNVRCPVNGDGYFYTRRELLCPSGTVVGSVADWDGPSGEL